MPGIFETPASRRKFLGLSAALASGALLHGAETETPKDTARVALLSDTHIPGQPTATNGYRGFVPADNLTKVVEQVVASSAEISILNGDAARSAGYREDYQTLKGLLAPIAKKIPIHIGLGNHDDRSNFFREFPQDQTRKELVQGKHVSLFTLRGTTFVVLDSLLYVNKTAGLLGKQQRDWLETFLKGADDQPIVFFVHHTLGEYDGELLDYDRMLKILHPYKQVKAIFCGHAHTYRVEQRDHIQVINLPAIGYNFNDSQPVGWIDAAFTPHGVDLKLHAVGGNRSEDGKTRSVRWHG